MVNLASSKRTENPVGISVQVVQVVKIRFQCTHGDEDSLMGKRGRPSLRERVGVDEDVGPSELASPSKSLPSATSSSRCLRRRVDSAGDHGALAVDSAGDGALAVDSAGDHGARTSMKRRVDVDDAEDPKKKRVAEFVCGDSPITQDLLHAFAKGQMSAVKLLNMSTHAAQQGAQSLGKMKREKEVPQNASRDALRAIGWPSRAPKLKYIELPFVDGKKQHPVFDPADFFSTWRRIAPSGFKKELLVKRARWRSFWPGCVGHLKLRILKMIVI